MINTQICCSAGVDLITACDIRLCTQDAWFQVKVCTESANVASKMRNVTSKCFQVEALYFTN